MENFAVKSESFALYEAFKKDVEKIGWEYNESFNPFLSSKMAYNNCLYFGNKWSNGVTALSLAFSNSGGCRSFRLETQYGEALAFAKKVWEQENRFKFGFSGICSLSSSNTLDMSAMSLPSTCSYSLNSNVTYPHLVCPYNPAFYDTTHLDLTYGTLVVSNPIVKITPKFKTGDYLTMKNKSDTWIGVLRDKLSLGDNGFHFYAGLYVTGKLYINDSFGFQNGDTMDFSTPSEIALLDSKLAEKGKRFDKEKCELVDIPKFKVGDWFIPHKPKENKTNVFWAKEMDEFDGVVLQVSEPKFKNAEGIYSEVADWHFHPDWCEKITAPKYKEPIVGEMAIFWDRRKDIAIISVFETKVVGEFTFRAKSEESFRNAILFESAEQYKDFLKS